MEKPGKCWHEIRVMVGGYRYCKAHCHLPFGHQGEHEHTPDPEGGF